jgi:hypothetical protein
VTAPVGLRLVLAGCATLALAGCAGGTPDHPGGPRLTAKLVSPVDVELSWTGADPGAAGHTVEYATYGAGPYTVLAFVPAGRASYQHPNLMPQTTFTYRLRPFYGPVSASVQVSLPAGDFDPAAHQNDQAWADPKVIPHGPVTTGTTRSAAATPTDLTATVMDPNSIRFTWTDHASDEEGYLLEAQPAGSAGWSVAATLDRDINSVGLVTLPTEKRAAYRVRPYYFGAPSNTVSVTTGGQP